MGAFIAKLLLPTVSSLVFLPTASVAAKRGFHLEAMVYFFTMFFTTIFHACDGPGLSIICFMRYDVLQYFSVYGTALSMWVTLIALGEFEEPQRSSITMFGVLTIAVRIYQDRLGYGVYSGPIGSAVFILTVKWLQKMKQLRSLFPEKSVYTQQVGPGCCFGALALMLRFYFEEWDYAYVHSFYHLCLAVSFVLLLPKKNRFAVEGQSGAKLSWCTLCCCTMSPGSTKEKTEKAEGKKKKTRTVWTIPMKKNDKTTPTLPLFHDPPSTKETGIRLLKDLSLAKETGIRLFDDPSSTKETGVGLFHTIPKKKKDTDTPTLPLFQDPLPVKGTDTGLFHTIPSKKTKKETPTLPLFKDPPAAKETCIRLFQDPPSIKETDFRLFHTIPSKKKDKDTPTLPLFQDPPSAKETDFRLFHTIPSKKKEKKTPTLFHSSTAPKGSNVSRLKELNGWK